MVKFSSISSNPNKKLKISYKINTCWFSNTDLNDQWVRNEVLKIPRTKWKWKHNLPETLWYIEALLRGKFTAMNSYIKKSGRSQINNTNNKYTEKAIRKIITLTFSKTNNRQKQKLST
jgi:hypothetical protein